ncbi:MAG: NAD(P)H-hydrate dehydratase [Methanobacterium sp.]|nr:NAD(P)H-hydrate dehydratase [Methanobacterium sp.]
MTPKDMMVLDANAEAMGIPRQSLMENAGRCLAYKIIHLLKPCKVVIFAGTGGNGGDGFVSARYLMNKGFEVHVYLLGHPYRIKSKETAINWEVLKKIKELHSPLKISVIEDSADLSEIQAEIIIDALLGTGTEGKLREPISKAVEIINKSKAIKIAVDIPSGMDPLTGKVFDKSVQADFTFTFHQEKSGFKDAKAEYLGEVHVCDIGIPTEAEITTGPGDLLRLNKRLNKSHKGQNGRVLIIGGSKDYSGAPSLAALSALKSGADLAVVACPSVISSSIRSYSPDLIVNSLTDDFITPKDIDKILKLSENADSLVIGCGMGTESETAVTLNYLLEKLDKPVVIDADALKIIDTDLIKKSNIEIVLTPHAAEFKALFSTDVPEKLEQKIEILKEVSKSSESTVLLKGNTDIIVYQDNVKLNTTGNPGMTVGGTGDCLAGLIGGLIAQGHQGYEAAFLGAYINGRAGDMAFMDYGVNLTATDLLNKLPKAFKK